MKIYEKMSDREIVELVLAGDKDAAKYLVGQRYLKTVRHHANSYSSHVSEKELHEKYVSDAIDALCGCNGDWHPLQTFRWESGFNTWFDKVIKHHFLKIWREENKEHIKAEEAGSIRVDVGDRPLPEPRSSIVEDDAQKSESKAMVLEAITLLVNEEQRFVVVKDLKGFSHEEIAEMLQKKREKEGVVHTYRGKVTVVTAGRVANIHAAAKRALKKIIESDLKDKYYDE